MDIRLRLTVAAIRTSLTAMHYRNILTAMAIRRGAIYVYPSPLVVLTATAYRKAKKQTRKFPITTPTPEKNLGFFFQNKNQKRYSTQTLRISNIQKSLIFVTYV
jgi:hypothetical protein